MVTYFVLRTDYSGRHKATADIRSILFILCVHYHTITASKCARSGMSGIYARCGFIQNSISLEFTWISCIRYRNTRVEQKMILTVNSCSAVWCTKQKKSLKLFILWRIRKSGPLNHIL